MADHEGTPDEVVGWARAKGNLKLVMSAADGTRAAGNKHFKSKRWATALHHYHSAAFTLHGSSICQVVDTVGGKPTSDADATRVLESLRAVLNNAALCCLKLEEFDLALEACRLVLGFAFPEDDKAAFRAALASRGVSDGKAAGLTSSPELVAEGREAASPAASTSKVALSMHDGMGALLRGLKDAVQAHMPDETAAPTAAASVPDPVPATTPAAPAPVTPQAALKVAMLTSTAVSEALGGAGWSMHRVVQEAASVGNNLPSVENAAWEECGGVAVVKNHWVLPESVQTAETLITEAWEMRWQLPTPAAAGTFLDRLVLARDENGCGALEGLPLLDGESRLALWNDPSLASSHVAVGTVAVPSIALPASVVAEIPAALQGAVGAAVKTLSAGVAVLAVDATVIKVFVCGPAGGNVSTSLHKLAQAACVSSRTVAATGAG